MASEQLLLDPTSEGTGTQLDITDNTLGYYLISHDYPPPDEDTLWASSADTEGERSANTRHKNRTITTVVRCIEPAGGTPSIGTIVKGLQQKIGKLHTEGGTYRRVLPSGDTITFDVQRGGATISVPADKRWIARKAADVTMTFVCVPYGRGAETTLTPHSETTLPVLVFTETAIKGDVPAAARLVVTEAQGQGQDAVIWGVQSRYYDAASTAALFFEAETGMITRGAATAAVGPAGASGSGTNKVIQHTGLPTLANNGGIVLPIAQLGPSGVVTHLGLFRVFARVQVASANTGGITFGLQWSLDGRSGTPLFASTVFNDLVNVPVSAKGDWVIVDLGLVQIPPKQRGANRWYAAIGAVADVSAEDAYLDYAFLVPASEGSGIWTDGVQPNGKLEIASSGVVSQTDTTNDIWAGPGAGGLGGGYEGDLIRVPPAGAEGRTARFIVKMTRDRIGVATSGGDAGIDDLSAQLFYTPRYLVVPEP